MADGNVESKGKLVAAALSGAWRCEPEALKISDEELSEISYLLLISGAGSLGWWKLRSSELRAAPPAFEFQQAYRLHTLQSVFYQDEIKKTFALLRSKGIEPLLVKGWSIARLYAEPGLRPSDDIDLVVRPEDYLKAEEAINAREKKRVLIDLHKGFDSLDDRRLDDLFGRSHLIKLDEADIRVLSDEDHLRVLSIHLLRHGAWRPLWLCDIAAAVESRHPGFDWDRCLGDDRRRADWVACAIGLAHQLLGARVDDTPVAARARRLPKWLVPAVLRQWGSIKRPYEWRRPMTTYLTRPAGLLSELRLRWPNPVKATVAVNGPFNELPRLPFQLGDYAMRCLRFLARVPGLVQNSR